jgi:hypothetical protein
MRLPRIRLTVRGMMLVVLGVGICLHVTMAAWRAHRYGTPHLHSAIVKYGNNPGKAVAVRSEPFWPSFLRHSTGLSWGRGCLMQGDAMLEMCELANPEIRIPSGPNTYVPRYTREQLELMEELSRAYWSRCSPARPVLDGEPIYEDPPISFDAKRPGHSVAEDVRRPAYWDLFSGASGHTYGHPSVWQMWAPGRTSIDQPLMPWDEAIDQPGAFADAVRLAPARVAPVPVAEPR